jgi:hypothetical protein
MKRGKDSPGETPPDRHNGWQPKQPVEVGSAGSSGVGFCRLAPPKDQFATITWKKKNTQA